MFKELARKIRRFCFFLRWSPKKRAHLFSLLIISSSIVISLVFVLLNSLGKLPFDYLPKRLDQKKEQIIFQIAVIKNKILKEPEVFRFDLSDIEKYAYDSLSGLTTDELAYVKSNIERETKIDPKLPRQPNSTPPSSKPTPPEISPPDDPAKPPGDTPEPEPEPEPGKPPTDPQKMANEILKYINIERRNAGVGELSMNNTLVTIALSHSKDMHNRNYFSHTTPEGVTFPQRLQGAGFTSGGENLYYAGISKFPANEPVAAWLQSSGHRRNMLYSGFKQIGIGVSGPYVTADFAP